MPCFEGPKGIAPDALSYVYNLLYELLRLNKASLIVSAFRWTLNAEVLYFLICGLGPQLPYL